MFTRCPECGTVFRVTANQLRAARGDVRCGNCAHIFNAMEYLADDLPDADVGEPDAGEMTEAGQADTNLETPADAAADTLPRPETNGVTETDAEGADSAPEAMEFDAPETTWSEFFIEAQPASRDIPLDGELEAITADPEEWRSMLAEIGVEPPATEASESPEPPGVEARDALTDNWSEDESEYPEPVYVVDPSNLEAANDIQPDGDDLQEPGVSSLGAGPAPDVDPPPWSELPADEDTTLAPAHTSRWAAVALLLCLTLVLQLTHQSRDALAAHPRYGEWVRNFYARLDERLYPDWSLDAFAVRRSEALAGGTAPNALDINAAVDVSGAHPIGLPLVRVTLRDQWANTVGSRVFVPREYLSKELPAVVEPGTRIPVSLSLADPGTSARGYEIDLCLPRRARGLECQQIRTPFRQ